IALTARWGTASAELDGLFDGGSRAWAFVPTVSLPIFDGGRRRANLELGEIRSDMAVAQYEKAIQTAFREVADGLAARRWLSEQITVQRTAVQAQAERARLAQLRYDNGSAAYLEVLDAQRDLLAARQQLVQARRAL
ncbi:TolC family protein, partial [Burkholderia sola]